MNKKLYIIGILFTFLSAKYHAQLTKTPVQEWATTNGTQNFFFKSITKTDALRNVYIAGATLNGNGDYDLLLIKYDPNGLVLWTKQYNGAGNGDDAAVGIFIDASYNVFVTGTVYTSAANKNDIVTIMYNGAGVQQWLQTYNAPASGIDVGGDIIVGSNNVYITGGVQTTNGFSDYATIKYNITGVQQWVSTYDYNGLYDGAQKITFSPTGSGTVTVAGGVQFGLTTWQYGVVSYNATTGAQLSANISGGNASGVDEVRDITKDDLGNVYVTGSIVNTGTGNDMYTIKLNAADLSTAWIKIYNSAGSQTDKSNSVSVDANYNVYITGYSQSTTEAKNYTTIKYNSAGVQQWVQTYNGKANGDDEAVALVYYNNQVFVTGTSLINGNKDYYTIAYTDSGVQQWEIGFNGNSNKDDIASAIAIDNNDNIIVAGQSNITATSNTYSTVKYLQKDYYKPISTELNSSNMGYIQNRGQIRNSDGTSNATVKFYNNRSTPSTYIDDAKIGYVWSKSVDTANTDTLFRVDMQFNKGNSNKPVYPVDFKSEYYNFYLKPLTVGKERTLACNSVVKFDAYTNTDVVFTHNRNGYKTYIIARSGAPTANFEMQYTGQTSLTVNGSGNLVIATALGSKIQPKAKAYTMNNTTGVMTLLGWQPTYVITGGNKVSFTYGTWPTGSTLVIEMKQADGNGLQSQQLDNVDWSTFFGGTGFDGNNDVVTTPTNTVYTCGGTNSSAYAQFTGNVVTPFVSNQDVFICKFNEFCEAKWFAYYGGENSEGAWGIALDGGGKIDVVGYTETGGLNFGLEGLNYTTIGGTRDGLFLRFDSDGGIESDSYIGGEGVDEANSIVAATYFFGIDDPHILLFIGGYVTDYSGDFPITTLAGAYNQSSTGGGKDGFVMAFDVDDDYVVWSTFFGGEGDDVINDVTIKKDDGDPNLVVTGFTISNIYGNTVCDVPTNGGFPNCAQTYYPNAYHQANFHGNTATTVGNHFISEFDNSNFKLVWSTYFGRAGSQSGVYHFSSITSAFYDSNPYLYLTGGANFTDTDFPYQASSNSNAYNRTQIGGTLDDGFLAKFASDNSLLWSTFLGGDGEDLGYGVTVNTEGDAFVTGFTAFSSVPIPANYCTIPTNTNFPICDNSGVYYIETNTPYLGSGRTFVMGFNKNDQLQWSTLYGQTGGNFGKAVSASNSKLFLCGSTDTDYTLVEFDTDSPLDYYQSSLANLDDGRDGTMARFDIAEVTIGLQEQKDKVNQAAISIYPNPAHNQIEIRCNKSFDKNDIVNITNATGQKVMEVKPIENKNNVFIDISKLASGIYTAQWVSKNASTATKFIKE